MSTPRTSADTGSVTKVTPASGTEMVSIMMATPTTCVTEVTSWMRPWLSDWLNVSTSLVMRESTSPLEMDLPSKYERGTLEILSAIWPRMRNTTFCVMPVMIQLWRPDAAALAA